MLLNLLAIVLLTGLTAASLLVCLAKWGVLAAWEVHRRSWMPKRCDFCASYHVSVLLLLLTGASLAWLALVSWYWLPAAWLLGLPAAAVCRAVVGPL